MNTEKFERFKSLIKRRGFIFPSSDIYGGAGNLYDFGPLGSLMKNNLKKAFLDAFVKGRDDIELVDAAIIMKREVWQASGHESNFSDPLIECLKCHNRFREDHLKEGKYGQVKSLAAGIMLCPICKAELPQARAFNMMFKTYVGPAEDSASLAYLRPETAQGIFVNFKNVWETSRQKIPFGIAQIGKAFRNEITPGDFIFRTREFEQGEIEFFISEDEKEERKWFEDWFRLWWNFYVKLGLDESNIQAYDHKKEDLAHYSRGTRDINYHFPFGWSELSGVAKRGSFDLKAHMEKSKVDLSVFEATSGKKFLPWVIEPTMGIDRAMFAFLIDSYKEYPTGRVEIKEGMEEKGEAETVLHLSPLLAPYTVAVLPLIKKKGLPEKSAEVLKLLRREWYVAYDESASIGRRYRRQDEIGTPFCVTIDFQTLEDDSVTVRDRDSMKQDRVNTSELIAYIRQKIT